MPQATSPDLTRIRAQGKRVTAQRRLVLEAVQRARHHITADEVTRAVHAKDPKIDPSTVYRNLEALEESGLVSHTHLDDRVIQWHRAEATRHGHLVCRRCGDESEIPEPELAQMERRLRTRYGFEADLGHSAMVGLCRDCAAATP